MSIVNRLRYLYLAWFSKPKSQRAIYRSIVKRRVASILELGIGDGERSLRMLQLASQCQSETVRYAAIDQFEMRPEEHGPPLPLKEAHRKFRQTSAQARLLPGDAFSALARGANSLGTFDLVIISACQNDDALGRAWFYFPRMLHDRSLVLVEEHASTGESSFRVMPRSEIDALAQPSSRRRAA